MIHGISPLEFLPLFLLSLNAFQKYYSYLSRSVSCKNSYPLPFPLGSVGSKSSLLSLHLSSTPCLTAGLFVISQPNCVWAAVVHHSSCFRQSTFLCLSLLQQPFAVSFIFGLCLGLNLELLSLLVMSWLPLTLLLPCCASTQYSCCCFLLIVVAVTTCHLYLWIQTRYLKELFYLCVTLCFFLCIFVF